MSIKPKNSCFGVSIATLWKEQENALKIIEGGTTNLVHVSNQMRQYVDDFSLEKQVEPTYGECYHRKLEAKQRCIDISILESKLLAEKVKFLASKVFAEVSRPKISEEDLRKLEVLGYDRSQIELCQTALEEEKSLMQMKVNQCQLRTFRFQEAAKAAQKVLKLAQKNDVEAKTQSWSEWFFGSGGTKNDVDDLTHMEGAVLPADWMVHAYSMPISNLQEFAPSDRFVGYLGVLLSQKSLKVESDAKPQIVKKKSEKRVAFQDLDVAKISEEKVFKREEADSSELRSVEPQQEVFEESLLPKGSQKEVIDWDQLNEIKDPDIAPNDNIFSAKWKCLEGLHGIVISQIERANGNVSSISDLLTQVTNNITWNYDPQKFVTAEFQIAEFRQRLDEGFAQYLQQQSYLESLDLAIASYQEAVEECKRTLLDDETIATLKGFRFPTWPLKENRRMVSYLTTKLEHVETLKAKVDFNMLTLKRKLDLAVLAEKTALKETSSTANVFYSFRRGYDYFEEGLRLYQERNQNNDSNTSFVV